MVEKVFVMLLTKKAVQSKPMMMIPMFTKNSLASRYDAPGALNPPQQRLRFKSIKRRKII
eukprot:1896931-Amphidinium_carterae.1